MNTARIRSWWPVAVLLAASIALAYPIWRQPYVPLAHDVETHLFHIYELDQQIHEGVLYPLRFPDLTYGYGSAVLSYYPPLAYYLAELIHLFGANVLVAYKFGMTLMVAAAALSSYYLGKTIFNRHAGLVIGLAYIANPYFLTDVHVRGALSEVIGLAIAPLIFAGIFQVAAAPGWQSFLLTSLAAALLVLAHPLSTMLFAPFILAYALLMWLQAQGRRLRVFGVLTASAALAGFMTIFYWLPARLEPDGLRTMDFPAIRDYYLAALQAPSELIRWRWLTDFPKREVVANFTIAVPVLIVGSLCYFGFALHRRSTAERVQYLFFLIGGCLALWFMSVQAGWLWQHAGAIIYSQFPFRWFGPLALFTAVVIGAPVSSFAVSWPGRTAEHHWGSRASLFAAAVAGAPAGALETHGVESRLGMAYASAVALFVITSIIAMARIPFATSILASAGIKKMTADDVNRSGILAYEHDTAHFFATYGCWPWGYEYVPSSTSVSNCQHYIDALLNDQPIQAQLPVVSATFMPDHFADVKVSGRVSAAAPFTLALHAFAVPGWSATVDNVAAATRPVGDLGLIGVDVPAGEHTVQIEFGPTWLRQWALFASALAVSVWLALTWWKLRGLAAVATVALVLLLGMPAWQSLLVEPSPALHPSLQNFGDKIALQAYSLEQTEAGVAVRLVWLARQPMTDSYKIFVAINDDQGNVIAKTDSRPQAYVSNTNRWLPGQLSQDTFVLPIPSDRRPCHCQVRIGWYNEADGQRLPVLDASGKAIDDQVMLSYIDVK